MVFFLFIQRCARPKGKMAEPWLLYISVKLKHSPPLPSLLGLSFEFCCVDLSSTGITNCEFHTGRAEKILPQLLKSKEDGQVIAVVNPARAGLRKNG